MAEQYHIKTEWQAAQMNQVVLSDIANGKKSCWQRVEEKRSNDQNRLQRQWINEAARQGDQTAEEYRAFCKLHFGVPILRAENEDFLHQYNKTVMALTYEQKLEIMKVPIDFPVTRLMNKKQKTMYLDAMYLHFTGLGFLLSDPESRGRGEYPEAG